MRGLANMEARRSMIVVEHFYRNPLAVREHALRQAYYLPYEDELAVQSGDATPTWWATYFKPYDKCRFKSSLALIKVLEAIVGETVDIEHWRAPYPIQADGKPIPKTSDDFGTSCLWNCCFHVKPNNKQQLGNGVHNHVTDTWNSVGENGWAGIIYLNPHAPIEGGLHLWTNTDSNKNYDWMTSAENWRLTDSLGNLFNRLILVRGNLPHSGSGGWGDSIENGRMYQTFFFRTNKDTRNTVSLSMDNIHLHG
jgi:hypothetical protein